MDAFCILEVTLGSSARPMRVRPHRLPAFPAARCYAESLCLSPVAMVTFNYSNPLVASGDALQGDGETAGELKGPLSADPPASVTVCSLK